MRTANPGAGGTPAAAGRDTAGRPAGQREPRPVGRPRSGTADRSILDAAMGLLSEVGLAGVTMSAVVSRSRVARATVYRRYPTREALISATLAHVKGREPFPLTGDIEADIATGVVTAAAVFAEAPFRRYLPLFVTEALQGPAAARSVMTRVAPNHGAIAREYRETAAAAGLRTDVDPTIVGDIIQGTMLMRMLSTGLPPDAATIRQVVDILLRGLREPAAD